MEEIYLDNAATTRVDEEVLRHVMDVMRENYGNPGSLHEIGKRAREEFEAAREKIAAHLGCEVGEVVFTSGGTESNNLAIRGLAKKYPEKKHIVTSVIEHPSVLEVVRDMEKQGYEVDYLGVDEVGRVRVEDLEGLIRKDTLLVSVMHVNNEIGVIQDIGEIGVLCREKGVFFHVDNVQGFLKEDLPLASVDLMSVSGHKVYAPKGVGFLYVRHGVELSPVVVGGGQEGGLRSGTENVSGVVGLAWAIDVDFKIDEVRQSRDKIIAGLKKIEGTLINGDLKHRVYNNINVSFWGIEGESLMMLLNDEGVYVSTGSACASSKLKESYVLKAVGVDEMYIHGSIRISMDKDIIGKEDYVVGKIEKAVLKLREISPFKLPVATDNADADNAASHGNTWIDGVAIDEKGVENE